MFPSNYPFAPPAIRMHTPSGRFQPSSRLCLSISDFHPRSFNPAWEVSTILNGLLSFMTSEEMTTGSVSASEAERKYLAARSRWWNSTGGGSHARGPAQRGNVKAGDGGAKFRQEWVDVDAANWEWMRANKVDPATGNRDEGAAGGVSCGPQLGIGAGSGHRAPAVVGAVMQQQRAAGWGWVFRNKLVLLATGVFVYVLIARLLAEGS